MEQVGLSPRTSLGVVVVSLFVLLALMSYQVTDPETGQTVLASVAFRLFSPFQLIVSEAFGGVAGVFRNYIGLVGANKENVKLKRELDELKIQLEAQSQQNRENERLRRILQFGERLPYRAIAGEIIGRDPKPAMSETVTANRGGRHGIKREMPVVTPEGVIGITILTGPFTSKIQLITDASSSIGAMIQSSRTSGILSGTGNGRCVLKFLPINVIVQKGEAIVTSGQDGIFPEGLPVGRVVRTVTESEFYRSAEVEPYQDFSSVREVIFLSPVPGVAAVEPSEPVPTQSK